MDGPLSLEEPSVKQRLSHPSVFVFIIIEFCLIFFHLMSVALYLALWVNAKAFERHSFEIFTRGGYCRDD